jgi:A/G-specific adenine glycosylase
VPVPVPIPPARRRAIQRKLLGWYQKHRRDLPWRFPQDGADPYRVWLAEVMLQQTQVAAAIPYYRRFVERFPTLESLAEAKDDDVFALWSGLGYYARCRNLLAAARAVVNDHGGELPRSVEGLRALPGFGPYTAGAVASIAFAVPAPIVDGNVARVLSRLFALEGAPEEKGTRDALWSLAAELVPDDLPGDFNQALMELGATLCGKGAPACDRCPVAAQCQARERGLTRELPRPKRAARRKPLLIVAALIERKGAWLLRRRPAGGLFGGLWELPGVELSAAQRPGPTLERALQRQLGGRFRVGLEVGSVDQVLTHRNLTLRAYRCRPSGWTPRMGSGLRWVRREELGMVGIAAVTLKMLARLP